MKLKQICNHPAQFFHDNSSIPNRSGKLARLREMLDVIIAEGNKSLIFTQFKEMGLILQTYLKHCFKLDVPFLHGGTTQKRRDKMVATFQKQSSSPITHNPIFIISLKAGGTGLNLTAANHVFHFDHWWNPAV